MNNIKKTIYGISAALLIYSSVKISEGIYSSIENINEYFKRNNLENVEKYKPTVQTKLRRSLLDLSSTSTTRTSSRSTAYDSYGKEINLKEILKEVIWKRGYNLLDDSTIKNETINYPFEIVEEGSKNENDLGDGCLTQCIYIETEDTNLKYAKIDVPTGTEFAIRTCYNRLIPSCEVVSFKLEQTILILSINSENDLVVDSDGFKLTKFNQSGLQAEDYFTVHDDTSKTWKKLK